MLSVDVCADVCTCVCMWTRAGDTFGQPGLCFDSHGGDVGVESRVTEKRDYLAQKHAVQACLGSYKQSSVVGVCGEWLECVLSGTRAEGERKPSRAVWGLDLTPWLGGTTKALICGKRRCPHFHFTKGHQTRPLDPLDKEEGLQTCWRCCGPSIPGMAC